MQVVWVMLEKLIIRDEIRKTYTKISKKRIVIYKIYV